MRSAVSRADLVRLVARLPDAPATALGFVRLAGLAGSPLERGAALLGFETPAVEPEPEIAPAAAVATPPLPPVDTAPAGPVDDAPAILYRFEEMTFTDDTRSGSSVAGKEPAHGLTSDDLYSPGCTILARPPTPPLAPWPRLWPAVAPALEAIRPGRAPDVPALVRALEHGKHVARIPRRARRVMASRISLWIDRSARLVPFWDDQLDVYRRLRALAGTEGIDLQVLGRDAHARMRRGDLPAGFRPDATTPVLVLGDLGMYGAPLDCQPWRHTARRLAHADVRITALLPGPLARLDPALARAWSAVPWERGSTRHRRATPASVAEGDPASALPRGPGPADPARGSPRLSPWQARAERLLLHLAPAAFVEPGLLRAIRRLLPPGQVDAASEADAWSHPAVCAADAIALVLHPDAARRWRERFAREVPAELASQVSALIGRWHRDLPRELLRTETLIWHTSIPGKSAPPGDLPGTLAFYRRLGETARAVASGTADHAVSRAVQFYGDNLLASLRDTAYKDVPDLAFVWAATFKDAPDATVPATIELAAIRDALGEADEPRMWGVRQIGHELVFSPLAANGAWPSADEGPGSPVAWLLAARPHLWLRRGERPKIQLRLEDGLAVELGDPTLGKEETPERLADICLETDASTVVLRPWSREPWAVSAGRDRFGLWADASVAGAVQRFRWIPPGRFLMGSPENEAGRWNNEGPQHLVTFTRGRWLADTPVTQELWTAVMGTNPSQFESLQRPVEQVSWDDCEAFLARLARMAPDLDPRFPGEAEWEHACRAGTATATWLGDLEILGERDAPLLDRIAWYGGNSGHEFDLPGQGYDSSEWPDKQHQHVEAGTRLVRTRTPGPLGLHDMLGNVYEWCRDRFDSYGAEPLTDPYPVTDPTDSGSNRVSRGGSWYGNARIVRAADRCDVPPGTRLSVLGLRLARGRAPGQAAAEPPGTRSVPGTRSAGRAEGQATARDAPSRATIRKRRRRS